MTTHDAGIADRPQVWAIGGGKGGTGKSLVAASFGIHLAEMGRRVVLVDGDLGTANAHTFLGMAPPEVALGDFIERRVTSLDDVAVETSVPRLRLISGAGNRFDAESLKYFQKVRLLKLILDLRADVVLVDLGAGTSLNVLDLFCIADRGVVVILPEPTSIENGYRFMMAAFRRRLRRLGRALGFQASVDAVLHARRSPMRDRPREILEELAHLDTVAAGSMQSHLQMYLPHLIINQARVHDDALLGDAMRVICDRFLGLPIHFAGAIPYDPVLVRTIKSRRPLLVEYPRSGTAESFRSAAEEIDSVSRGPEAGSRWEPPDGDSLRHRDPYRVLEMSPHAAHREILAAYLRLRSTLRSDSPALLPLDCEVERRSALAEVEDAFRSISRNSSTSATRTATPNGRAALPIRRTASARPGLPRQNHWPRPVPRPS
jgi:flagellar biosynthesis protein FlhG